jgi:hypothetical protein
LRLSYRVCVAISNLEYIPLIDLYKQSRENTVLRGQLFEGSEEDPNILQVRQNLYVIPNALVAEQFKPCGQPSTDTSKRGSIKEFL